MKISVSTDIIKKCIKPNQVLRVIKKHLSDDEVNLYYFDKDYVWSKRVVTNDEFYKIYIKHAGFIDFHKGQKIVDPYYYHKDERYEKDYYEFHLWGVRGPNSKAFEGDSVESVVDQVCEYLDCNYGIVRVLEFFREQVIDSRLDSLSYGLEEIYDDIDIYYECWPGVVVERSYKTFAHGAVTRLKQYDDLSKLLDICNEYQHKTFTKDSYVRSTDPMEKHLGRFEKPMIYRSSGNDNKNTFDFIKTSVSVLGVENKLEFVKQHKNDICNTVLDKIAENRTFQKYGVPVNILRLTNLTMGNSGILYFTFEPKELKLRKGVSNGKD